MRVKRRQIRDRYRRALYGGVSALALAASGALSPAAAASVATMLSPTGLAQVASQRSVTSASTAIQATGAVNPAYQAQAALSAANLARAAQAIKDTTAAQAAARASSQLTLNNVPLSGSSWNGAVLSGLNPVDDTDPAKWINADPLRKDTESATATVKQTAANALLTWQSLDLNNGETLVFDQQDHADWTVLNRVVAGPRDPVTGSRFVASPSMILGKIEAAGSVYVINPNGIIFGSTAEINVHSLIASSLDVGNPIMTQGQRDAFFLNTGILGNGTDTPAASFSYNPNDTVVEGNVRIDAGAVITTSLAPRTVSPDAGGFVYLFAPNVENHGTISTPAGETLMVAAQFVRLIANAYPDGGIQVASEEQVTQTFRGVGVDTADIVWRLDGPESAHIATPGHVLNTGVIDAGRGVAILNGDYVTNTTSGGSGGIIRADTSVTRNGQIFLDARLQLTLGEGSSVQILPDQGEETIPLSAIANFHPGSVEMSGNTINLESRALVIAPGANVSASSSGNVLGGLYPEEIREFLPPSTQRIYMASNAQIDVSGLNGVTLPMTANLITLKPFGNEFADQPLQREGALRGVEFTIDIRESGTLDGVAWIGTPLANVGGFINNIQQTVDWLLTTGGTVSLSSPGNGEIILRQGSIINIGGGSVQYEGGVVGTSKLLTVDGRVVDIGRANPLDAFVGIAGITTEEHLKWGSSATQIFESPVFSNTQFEPGYVEGHDAGGIALDANAYALEGSFYGAAIAGDRQRLLGIRPSAETANTNKANPSALPSAGYISLSGRNNLIIEAAANPLPDRFALTDILPEDRVANTRLSAATLSAAGFGRIAANFSGHLTVTSDAVLQVDNGGTIDLAGGSGSIAGQLIARSGTISLTSTAHIAGDELNDPVTNYEPVPRRGSNAFDLTIESTARLDTSGVWVNDTGAEPEDLVGSGYIDGGSITLKTLTRSAECIAETCSHIARLGEGVPPIIDLTGNIVLSEGSLLDVSSGGRVTVTGLMQLDSKGRPVGKGGNVTLEIYSGQFITRSEPFPPTLSPLSATVLLAASDGTPEENVQVLNRVISAYGLAQGGTLSIQVPIIEIGEVQTDAPGALSLSPDFFAGNAFGAYNLVSVAGNLTIEPGTTLSLRQQNLLMDPGVLILPSGAKLADSTGVGILPDFLRAPVHLSLSARLAPLPQTPYDPVEESPSAHVALRIGEDTIIEGDPAASVGIDVTGRPFWDGDPSVGQFPPVAQQIGVAEILGALEAPGGAITLNAGQNSTIWFGSNSVLDVSGVVIQDTRQPLFRTGTILPGGKVTISSAVDVNTAIVALNGALIDVSGAAGEFDLMHDGAFGLVRLATPVWSDAGSISITTATLLFDGGFLATPGSSQANGGRLTIAIPEIGGRGREVLTVRQSGNVVPEGLTPTDSLDLPEDTPPEEGLVPLRGSVFFKAASLNGSGIADLVLSASPIGGDVLAPSANAFAPGRIVFDGDVTISGLNSLVLDASGLSVVNIADTGDCNACLDARYVALRGSGTVSQFLPEPGFGRLRVSGEMIDIAAGGQSAGKEGFGTTGLLSLSGFGHARFVSSGDIRFRVPIANVARDLDPGTLPSGQLIARADLTFLAEQIYPVSSIDFTVKSLAPDATISFGQTGVPDSAPLSAGGQLTISAAHIEQGGRLLAPLGVIRLGAQSASELSRNDLIAFRMEPTQSVSLAPRSITSVSLDAITVPFGVTANETSWSYNSNFGQPLTAPPAKDIVVSGTAIDFAEGATLDFSGGGVIQAMEFVPGIGGSRDVLAAGGNVYAIIPGYNPAAAPIDLEFTIQQHDSLPAAGRSVFLSGRDGLPAGMYTLLPPHYATLPGAYRVSLVAGSLDALNSLNTVGPDGTMRMTGFFAQPGAGTRDPRAQFFDVQSSSVWRQYSEITNISGTAFFGGKTVGESNLPPRLPIDAGHAAFSAISGLNLEGIIDAARASGGRGGQLDIAALDIEVLPPGGVPTHAGLLPLDATQLSTLGVESLLIGGVRSPGDDGGDKITVVANAVRIHNNASAPLEAPEIILVSKPGSGVDDPNAAFDVRLDADSVVRAVGEVADPAPRLVTIGDEMLDIPGSGSLLAVSNGAPLTVVRENAKQANGEITMVGPDARPGAPGATLEGASLTLDTTGQIRLNTGVTVTGDHISIAAKSVSFGQVTDAPGGFIVRGDILKQLEQAQTLTLRAASQTINFYGDVNLALDGPGSELVLDAQGFVATAPGFVKLAADIVGLINSGEAGDPLLPGDAALRVEADHVELGAGDKVLGGFAFATFAGSTDVAIRDAGSLDAGNAELRFATRLFLVGAGADQSIITANLVTFAATDIPGAPTSEAEIGGTLAVKAASVDLAVNALIQASAGGVTLEATTGDIHLGENAKILATGHVQTFFDVTRVTGGGSVQLIADQGSIRAHATSSIDVSSPAGYLGYAGSIGLDAPNGWIFTDSGAFDMAIIAGSMPGDGGGRLAIQTRHLGDPAAPLSIPSIFSDAVNIHVSRGDLRLATDLSATNVTLTADQGVLTIDHAIDASGEKGGTISLFGGQGVVLTETGHLVATASNSEKHGGEIVIGTQVAAANGSGDAGVIDLQGGVIDVSNTANPANGGAILLRAPLTGDTGDIAVNTVQSEIKGATHVTVEAFKVFDTANSDFNGVIDPIAQPDFYGSCTLMGACTGTLVEFVQNFSLSADAQARFASIAPSILHTQPGIELVNNDPSINNGGITVANAWNLGAGFAGYLVSAATYAPKDLPAIPAGLVITDQYGNLLPEYAYYKGDLLFVPGVGQITSLVYRVGGALTGEPGTLTLRAVGDVAVNDSITDGFFNTRNVFDDDYQLDLFNWIVRSFGTTNTSNVGGYTIGGATFNNPVGFGSSLPPGPAPMAPFDLNANVTSPTFSAQGKTAIASADLFPLVADPNGPIEGWDGNYRAIESWSYRIVGGADVSSANPLALRPLAQFTDDSGTPLTGHGNVILDGHKEYNVVDFLAGALITYRTPTVVRTGTGSIDIAAARDFVLADTKAPGGIYTAGRNSVELPDPDFVMQTVADPISPGEQIAVPVATNPEGFLKPYVLNCDPNVGCYPYGPLTLAAYPVDGGHLTLTAQRDILGYEHPTILSLIGGPQSPYHQYFAPWLLAQGSALSVFDFGPFSSLSAYLSTGGDAVFSPSQTSWWINFGSFGQGLMSVGGDVRIEAGRDIQELSVSLPTTARVSGGLSSTIIDASGNEVANIPVMHLNGSSDLTIIAGRDLKSGAYYEGSGHAEIEVGGSVSASWAMRDTTAPISTVLALDTGTIALTVRQSVDIAGVVSGPSLQNVADLSGNFGDIFSQHLSSYGPSSKVVLQSIAGDAIANSLADGTSLVANAGQGNVPDIALYPGVNRYPASLEIVAFHGDVRIADRFRLAASDTGTLNLLAYDSLLTRTPIGADVLPMSTGPSLVEAVFDPLNPLAGFGPEMGSLSFDLGARLLHVGDSEPVRFYATTGDVISGPGGVGPGQEPVRPLAWEVTKPAKVRAAGDIVDLSFFGQNLAPTDVTEIIAGRDLRYAGTWQNLIGQVTGDLGQPENQGGLGIAGPGFIIVQAGRDLGPFVTAAADIAANNRTSGTDSTGTGIISFGNLAVAGNRRMISDRNGFAVDRFAFGVNDKLPHQGADIITLFGAGNGVDYQAVIHNYIDPATSTSPRDYLPDLVVYLQTLGLPNLSTSDAWTAFQALPPQLQNVFADKVFFSELRIPGDAEGCCFKEFSIGYSMINTLFPASLGYTDNGPDETATPKQAETGNLDLLHATIKTLQSGTLRVLKSDGTSAEISVGGNILVFGPGGTINVGTTAVEINRHLTNSAVGILTLNNGAISTFTDESVLVNQSRILTVQGGDILMWSSNRDLDAGRGAKTTVDFKPLSVDFAPNDLQTINLNGLVSGAGIGTIKSTPDAPAASAFLIAPRGIVNAGDAGLRSSGNLSIAALLVLNAANIATVGTVSGVPDIGAVNLGALESTAAVGGQAAQAAQDAVAEAANRGAQVAPPTLPSLITVEVFIGTDPDTGMQIQ